MAERHHVGVYWGDRRVTKEQAVATILDMTSKLRAQDALLSRWYPQLATREASRAAELTEERARERLGVALAPGAEDDPNHGWVLKLWNGHDEALSARIELSVGASLGLPFCPAPNSCVLQLPRGLHEVAVDALVRRDRMVTLLAEMARVWEADWGLVSTDEYMLNVPASRPPHHPRVGWVTFLHDRRGPIPSLAKALVTPVEGLGVIVSTSHERFTSNDGDAVEGVQAMEDALAAAGALAPTGAPRPERKAKTQGKAEPVRRPPGEGAHGAALDAAAAIDALASTLPGRRADLADTLLRAATALVVAVATQGDAGRAASELRALLDLAERIHPGAGRDELTRAREALARVQESVSRPGRETPR